MPFLHLFITFDEKRAAAQKKNAAALRRARRQALPLQFFIDAPLPFVGHGIVIRNRHAERVPPIRQKSPLGGVLFC